MINNLIIQLIKKNLKIKMFYLVQNRIDITVMLNKQHKA